MEDKSKNILIEVLLELTLAIGSEINYDKIVNKTITLWLKRLNCTTGGIIINDKELRISYIVPTFLRNRPLHPLIKDTILNKRIEIISELKIEEEYYYLAPLYKDHFFFFSRTQKLKKEQQNELFPITQFFAKSLDNAKERAFSKKIQEELDTERRLLRTLIDHIPDAIFLKDVNFRKILANQADLKLTGYDKMEDIIHKTDYEIYSKDQADIFTEHERKIIEQGIEIKDHEGTVIDKHGNTCWILSSKFPLKNDKGEIIGLVGITRDITNHKDAQEELKRLSLVASQTTNAVIITDLNGKTEWVNEGFTRLSGFTLQEAIGKSPGAFLQGDDTDPEIIKTMSDALKNREPFNVEVVNYKKDGTPYWIHINCNPFKDEQGNLKGFMAIESDITEKVIFREELIRAKHIAEKAEKAEKTFLANMSHEIRTPLNAIIGMTSLLKDTTLNYEQKDYIETLDHSSKFLLRLINDILDLAKIESGKMELTNSPFDIRKVLKSIYQISQMNMKRKDVKVQLSLDKDIPQFVVGDEVLLQQSLNNLMSNAEKFTNKGSIHIKANLLQKKENLLLIEIIIEDTGIGISKENQKAIFDKFKQVGTKSNEEFRGTGLGLAITKDIVELFGGSISLESNLGIGSSFRMIIPLSTSSQAMDLTKNSNQEFSTAFKNRKKSKVLVVEDNFINQKYIVRLLEKLTLNHDVASNGKEAIDLVFKNSYSIILMDIQMPELNGYEASYMIRNSNNINQNTPIIALTASTMVDQRLKAKRMGMNGYLSKPFTPEQLKEKLIDLKII